MGIARRPRSGLKLPLPARRLSLIASLSYLAGDYGAVQLAYAELVSWALLVNRDEDHLWN